MEAAPERPATEERPESGDRSCTGLRVASHAPVPAAWVAALIGWAAASGTVPQHRAAPIGQVYLAALSRVARRGYDGAAGTEGRGADRGTPAAHGWKQAAGTAEATGSSWLGANVMTPFGPTWFLEQEARSLGTRLERIKPFVLQETMTPAAALLPDAQVGIERALFKGRHYLRDQLTDFIEWVEAAGNTVPPAEAQRRFTSVRMGFNAHLSELELFSDAITQRSESELGVWLSGLDVAAADGLIIPGGDFFDLPPIICYVDRGHGAAIRRISTRLPAGSANPVAIIRIPRERMIGHGIASSLLHEVGHQAAALLDLVASLRRELVRREQNATSPTEGKTWRCWRTWISEIVADFWSVAKLGVGSTLGLLGVVSLPRRHVFRVTLSDPHPFPWIRVKVSAADRPVGFTRTRNGGYRAAVGAALPPRAAPDQPPRQVIAELEPTIPLLARLLVVAHQPARCEAPARGRPSAPSDARPNAYSLVRAMASTDRTCPAQSLRPSSSPRWDKPASPADSRLKTRRPRSAVCSPIGPCAALSTSPPPAQTSFARAFRSNGPLERATA